MSHPSSIINALSEVPTAGAIRAEHLITLVDQDTVATRYPSQPQDSDAERNNSDATASQPTTPGPYPLVKRFTSNSLQVRQGVKRKLTERKYAKYTQGHYDAADELAPPDEDPANQPQHGEPANSMQTGYLERSRAKAKALWNRKKGLGRGRDLEDAVVDVLYENQRGMFLFGVPKYSASSLLPSDPKPWQNAQLRTSPVDIRNAQVPDPSWEWAWKSWYVDMSRDVDEEGWEYSLKFIGSSSWHGNHPWFHSFVRRRRWLRMRKRRDPRHHTKEKSHELTAEYFTIHPKTLQSVSGNLSRATSIDMTQVLERREEEPSIEDMEITDINKLMRTLKIASVDREKLLAMRKFAAEGGEELYYLPDQIPEIMGALIFQSSRRQLLGDLLHRHKEAKDKRESLQRHVHEGDEQAQKEHDASRRHATNLIHAVEAADEQVKKLEFWSDIKGMAQSGETLLDTKDGQQVWDRLRWSGLLDKRDAKKSAFASKQDATAGAPKLHQHAEHSSRETVDQRGHKESDTSAQRPSSRWFERLSKETQRTGSSDSNRLERYTTAPESAPDRIRSQSQSETPASTASRETGGAEDTDHDHDHPIPNINLTVEQTLHEDDAGPLTPPSGDAAFIEAESEASDGHEEEGGKGS